MPQVPAETRPPEPVKRHSVVRSAGVVSAAVFASRISGLVRESIMARLFGASQLNDAFVLGFRIPNLTRDLFAEGALSSAFVPTFTRYLTTKSKQEARELSNLVATTLIVIVGIFCVLGMVFSPQLVNLLAPGFHQVPGKFEIAVSLTRVMFPFLLVVALAAQAMGVLNACDQFGVPAMSSTFFNIGSVTCGLILGYWIGPHIGLQPIFGMAYGVVFGGAMQLFFQVPSLLRQGFSFVPRFSTSHPGLRQILSLMGPAILGNASVQINTVINTNFAAGITDAAGHVINGPVSWLSYAFRFMQLPLGLFGVSIASATLPAISRSAASDNIAEFRQTLSRSIAMVMLLTIPSSAGLAVLGESMIAAVYQGGHFTRADTHQTAIALACYSVGLTGYAALKVLAPAFYALNDARTPMLVSLCSIAVNYATANTMIRLAGLGHAGLALSTSAVALFGFFVLLLVMRRRIHGVNGGALLSSFLKITAASAVMSAVCWTVSYFLLRSLGHSRVAHLATLAIAVPLGGICFYFGCRLFKVTELDAARDAFAAPLMRRFGFGKGPHVKLS